MDEALSVRPSIFSVTLSGLTRQDTFSPIDDCLNLTSKMKVFLRLRSFTSNFHSNTEDEDNIFVVLNSTNLLTKIPIAEGTSSRRSKQPNNVETQNIRKYRFTNIFTPEVEQAEIFELTAKPNILDFLEGHSSNLMSYGTTNSGKSYTFFGTNSSPGIIPRSIDFLFSKIDCTLTPWYKPINGNNLICIDDADRMLEIDAREKLLSCRLFDKSESEEAFFKLGDCDLKEEPVSSDGFLSSIWLSFIEIYNETIFDLLAVDDEGKNVQLKLVTDKRGHVCLKGLRNVLATSGLEAYQILMAGKSRLSLASTAMNPKSSRSHAIFTMTLLKYSKEFLPGEVMVTTLTFCDLAGTGGLRKTSDPQRVKESRSINASLLVLGRCLKSVREGQLSRQGVDITGPFRESNLTRLFQKCLSGKENLTLLVNINPTPDLYMETQSVLNFSSLARKCTLESSKDSRRTTDSQVTIQTWKLDTGTNPSLPQTPVKNHYILQKEYDELKEENEALLQELSALKTSTLNKEYEIRKELSEFYSSMMKDLEDNWRKKGEEIEEERDDLLKWSVKQVEVYYKERIDNITNRKRRRLSDSGDHKDSDKSTLELLETENAEATSKIISLKKVVESLRKKNDDLSTQKSELLFQLAVTKKELKELKHSRILNESLETENEENDINKRRESFLFEFNEYWAKTTDLEEQLKEKTDLAESLKKQLENKDKETSELRNKWQKAETRALIATRKVEELETKLNDISSRSSLKSTDDRIIASSNVKIPSSNSSPDSIYKISMIEAESSLLEDNGTPNVSLKTLVRVPTLVPFELPEQSRLSFLDSSAEKSYKSDPRLSEASSKDDSGIVISTGSQSSTELNKIKREDKFIQVDIIQEEDIENIRKTLESLKLEYGKLKSEYSLESSKVTELKLELTNVRKSILGLEENSVINKEKVAEYESQLALKEKDLERLSEDKDQIEIKYNDILKILETTSKDYEKKIDELYSSLKNREENEIRASKCLDEYIGKAASLESQLVVTQAQLEKTTIKCSTEHVPKIESLEKELFVKTLRVSELNGKMAEVERDLVRIAELNEKVGEFEKVMDDCQREKEDLRRQIHERSETQSSLESKLKKLITRVQERESEVLSLQTMLEQLKCSNTVNSDRANELSNLIHESSVRMGQIKNELLRSEEARKNLEKIAKEEIISLRSRLSTFEKHGALLSMICQKNEKNQEELKKLKLELCEKEREMNLFKKNRDATIEKYELLVRQLQLDVEKNKHSRKMFPRRVTSKELTRSISESLRTKVEKSDCQGKNSSHTVPEGNVKFWKTFKAKPVIDERIFPLSASKLSIPEMAISSSSQESIPTKSQKSIQSEKVRKKETSQTEGESILEIVMSKFQEFHGNVDSKSRTTSRRNCNSREFIGFMNSRLMEAKEDR